MQRNSSRHHTKNCLCKSCHLDTSVQVPQFLRLPLISNVRDLMSQLPSLYICSNFRLPYTVRLSLGFFLVFFIFSFVLTLGS